MSGMGKRLRAVAALLMVGAAITCSAPARAAAGVTVTEAIPCRYDDAGYFSEGLAWVKLDGKWGFIDKAGREAVPCRYDQVGNFSEGLAWVRLDEKWGFIDKTGREVAPCRYDSVGLFSEGLAGVCRGDWKNGKGKWGFIDAAGEEVIEARFDDAGAFLNGLAMVERDGLYGYIDQARTQVVPCQYAYAHDFTQDGLALVMNEDGLCGYVDTTGAEAIPCRYDYANDFSQGLAVVRQGDKYGYIDQTGREVIPCQYDAVNRFSEGLAVVRVGDQETGKCGYIDQTGRVVIPCQYERANDFSEGLALVVLDGKWGFIDQTGREVVPRRYDYANDFSEGLAQVELDGKCGFIDQTGREVVPCKYNGAGDFSEGFAAVALDGKWGFLAIEDASAATTAYASTQTVLVDGGPVAFQCYALKDAAGNDTNYIKLRDLASVLNGTAVQFNVGWDGAVNIETGKAYAANGPEMSTPFSGNRAYEAAAAETRIDGSPAALDAIVLKDDAGGAYTYYKLRDLGAALGFTVGWSAETGIYLQTD